jgi:ribosome modulation factor
MSRNWNLDALEKAYQQGYFRGLIGDDMSSCRYSGDVVKDSWDAGWHDGNEAYLKKQKALTA